MLATWLGTSHQWGILMASSMSGWRLQIEPFLFPESSCSGHPPILPAWLLANQHFIKPVQLTNLYRVQDNCLTAPLLLNSSHLYFPPDSFSFCLSLEKNRLLRDNNQTWQNKIHYDEAKIIILKLDMKAEQNRKKHSWTEGRVPRAGKRVRDPLFLIIRSSIKTLS